MSSMSLKDHGILVNLFSIYKIIKLWQSKCLVLPALTSPSLSLFFYI